MLERRGGKMIGEYSTMDWVTLGSIATTAGAVITLFVSNIRDNRAVMREFEILSKEISNERSILSNENTGLSKEHDDLSREHKSIKSDTGYIRDEMLAEKMARESLYRNTSNAEEILDKLDFMREVVIQNSELHAENKRLSSKVATLQNDKQELLDEKAEETQKLLTTISSFRSQLVEFENYREAEEIQSLLRKIESSLSEYTN